MGRKEKAGCDVVAGLLYKDFVGIRGRRILGIMLGCTLAFLVLRFLFPGNVEAGISGAAKAGMDTAVSQDAAESMAAIASFGMVENEAGELVEITVGELRDSLLVMLPMLFIVVSLSLLSTWIAAICRHDEINRTRQYTAALPLAGNAYIASKYLFIGIAVYLLFSLNNIWIIIFQSVAGETNSAECLRTVSQFLMSFYGFMLVLASIELPFFITLGVKKGMLVKTALIEGAAFLAAAYLFFGNLDIFKNFNIYTFVNWCERHFIAVVLISILSPIVELMIFWLSYRITCRINQNRETEIYAVSEWGK